MFSRWTLRSQMIFGAVTMSIVVIVLSGSGIEGVLMFRRLTKSFRERATELPLNMALVTEIGELRLLLHQGHDRSTVGFGSTASQTDPFDLRLRFREQLDAVYLALDKYRDEIENRHYADSALGDDDQEELRHLAAIELDLHSLRLVTDHRDWVLDQPPLSSLDLQLERLQSAVAQTPTRMKQRLDQFAESARADYHRLLWLGGLVTIFAFGLMGFLGWRFRMWIFRPLSLLLEGSRRVASGDYSHRIVLDSEDELAELASAMNDMTMHFLEIRDDLDRQVRERSNEVIRNEQLASVGFLAAGVAHEINNPLASIAWAAESLESRVSDLVDELPWNEEDPRRADVEVIRKYLRRIQDESFRVKGITDGLLDFSRLGGTAKVETDLRELVDGVVEMVRHLARHRHKRLTVHGPTRLRASVCPQSMKQVVLNLVTNALESVDENGHVDIHLAEERDQVILRVIDDGCGMTTEVLEHLFEPFFTRKRDQQGTGLGLSISHRIVTEHQGQITPRSAGAGLGSEFVVTLPTKPHVKKNETQRQAA